MAVGKSSVLFLYSQKLTRLFLNILKKKLPNMFASFFYSPDYLFESSFDSYCSNNSAE